MYYSTCQNGCLPNEIYHLIIDWLINDWTCERDSKVYSTLLRCSLVCKAWLQKVQKYRNSTISITSIHQLLRYTKVVRQNDTSRCTLVQALSVDTMHRIPERPWSKLCSIIGTILLLIPKLPNLQKLSIFCNWYNDYHPTLLKLPSNMSVKVLHCTFKLYTHAIGSILEFIDHFQSIQSLSLTIHPFNSFNNSLRDLQTWTLKKRIFRKTRVCLTELHLDIEDLELLELVMKVFTEAKNYISHIHKYSYRLSLEYSDNLVDPHKDMLTHCSQYLESFAIVESPARYCAFPSKS